jgi:hypothetical protein
MRKNQQTYLGRFYMADVETAPDGSAIYTMMTKDRKNRMRLGNTPGLDEVAFLDAWMDGGLMAVEVITLKGRKFEALIESEPPPEA